MDTQDLAFRVNYSCPVVFAPFKHILFATGPGLKQGRSWSTVEIAMQLQCV